MASTPNDPPPAPDASSGVPGVPFGTGAIKPFKPGAPKLKPAVSAPADTPPPAFKLPAPKAAPPAGLLKPTPASGNAPTVTPLPGKALPPRMAKPMPKLASAATKTTPPALPAKPLFKAPPVLTPSKPSASPQTPSDNEEEDDLNEIFREEVESYQPTIISALNSLASDISDVDAWKQLKTKYHALKGAANTVGLPELGASAATAEKTALRASENSEGQSPESRDQLIETLRIITTELDIPMPKLDSYSTVEKKVIPVDSTETPEPEPQEINIPEIESVIIAFSDWQQNGGELSKELFLSESERFKGELDQSIFSGLHASFHQLINFCRKPLPSSPPPKIFCSVILHALNDARIYLQAKRYNPKLNWSRKWHFYFSSLQIALASHTESSESPAESRDPEMVEAFLEEAGENLQHIEEALMAWENGDQPQDRQGELRRHFHTLKGAANSVGLSQFGADFHILEDAMEKADSETAARNFLPHLFTCLDEARQYVELLQADSQSPWPGNWNALLHPGPQPTATAEMDEVIDPEMLGVFIEESQSLIEPIESATMSLEAGDQTTEQQSILRRHFHTLKGAANSVGLTKLGGEFHALEDFMDGELGETDSALLTSFLFKCLDDLRTYIAGLQNNPKYAWLYQWGVSIESLKKGETPTESAAKDLASVASAPKASAAEKQMLRVEAGQLQELMHMISELVAEQSKIQHYVSGLRSLHGDMQNLSNDSNRDSGDRATLKRLAIDINHIKESLADDDQLFRRYSKRIQSDLVELNMGPVGSLFHRLSRSFRDACKEEGKEAKWVPEGGNVQLDRAVVDQLYGPLLHVVRNAVAHGIESPDKRREVGKDPSGTVKIQAISKADHVIIEISDDGAGINTDAVRHKAIEKGLLDESVSSITSEEAVDLLFSAGFSTKDAVSNVAGRGVGLDVVKGDIEGLNGSVGVNNLEGQGTTWVIRVPLTLSASEALLVHADTFKIALPLSMVDRCTGLSPGHMADDSLMGNITIDDEPVSLLNLALFLGSTAAPAPTHAVVIDSGLGRAAIAVTNLDSRREIVMKDLGPLLAPLSFYSGVTSDVDGKLLPVLQIPYLLKWIAKHGLSQTEEPMAEVIGPLAESEPPETLERPEQATVLLADDSPSVRKVQEQQLIQLGFKVLLAKDGQEAIDTLQETEVDLLITDWEMPRVDGAALIQSTRNSDKTRNLPIIIISSKVNEAFEKEANTLGATACQAKPFQANQFLDKLKSTPYLSQIIAKLEARGIGKA